MQGHQFPPAGAGSRGGDCTMHLYLCTPPFPDFDIVCWWGGAPGTDSTDSHCTPAPICCGMGYSARAYSANDLSHNFRYKIAFYIIFTHKKCRTKGVPQKQSPPTEYPIPQQKVAGVQEPWKSPKPEIAEIFKLKRQKKRDKNFKVQKPQCSNTSAEALRYSDV